ncbi:MAG: GspE/PulE/PilB domain-containing protein, partial [Thermoguttaceae bacterium]
MAKEIDVYRDWLGIKESNRPLSHYQLLRLGPFEDDPAKIRTHYRKMNEHVRKFGTGEYADQSQTLLNELAKAMLCLTDLQRKREYDASLGRQTADEGRRRSLEEILLSGQVIDQARLDKARSFSDTVGVELHQAVLQQKAADPESVMMAYAESIGLPYIDLKDISVSAALAAQIPPNLARQHSLVPLMAD